MNHTDHQFSRLFAAVESVPSPTTPESGMVEAENLSAAVAFPTDEQMATELGDTIGRMCIQAAREGPRNRTGASVVPATELPILRDSAIDRALRGNCFIPTF